MNSPRGKKGKKKNRNRRNSKKNSQKKRKFLFDDLQGMTINQVKTTISDIKKAFKTSSKERENLQNERSELVQFITELRQTLMSPTTEEKKILLARLRNAQSERDEAQKLRDDATKRVPVSSEDIIKSLKQRHKPLTTIMNRLQEMPSLREEIYLFESYFEYQAMYEVALFSDEQHSRLLKAYSEIRTVMKELRKLDNDSDGTSITELKSKYPHKERLGWKELDHSSSRITEIDKILKTRRTEMRSLSNEIKRLEAFIRFEERSAKEELFNPEEIREKAESGESLTLQDLSTLISSGEIGKITKGINEKTKSSSKNNESKKTKRRRTSPRRGKSRTNTLTPKEDRRD